jgi:hypothetical protein
MNGKNIKPISHNSLTSISSSIILFLYYYYSCMLPLPPCSVEHLFIFVKINFVYYILDNAYFPHRSPITLYNKHFDIISDLLISYPYVKYVILVGDYNTPNLKWQFISPSCSPNYLNLNQLSVDFLSTIFWCNQLYNDS